MKLCAPSTDQRTPWMHECKTEQGFDKDRLYLFFFFLSITFLILGKTLIYILSDS